MSHRPYIKNDDSGNISDLAIDAETLQGYKPCINIITLEDNNSTTAGTWLAKTNKVSALVDGQLFLYKITVAGASTTTLNITGSGGALGAKTVYRTGTTKLTTQYAVGHYILLAYNSLNTCFRLVNDYDANSYAYVRQYQHGKNSAGATNLYPILTRYNLTNKNGKYDNAYARFYTDTYIDVTNGYLYAPKVYSGGSEVAIKTDIPTETTVSGWGFTKNVGTVTKVNDISPDSNGNVSIILPTKSSWNYDDRYVRFDTFEQNLTDEQKADARFNIGAASWDFSYNDLQDLPIGSIKEIPYTVKTYTENEEERTVLVATLIEKNEGVIWYFPAFTRRKPDGPYISGTYKLYAGKLGGQYSGEICILYGGEFMILDRNNFGLAIYNSKGLIYSGEIGDITSFVDRMYIPAINESDRESNKNLGSATKPVYLMRASYTDDHDYYYKPCSLYAGGTKVTLNGTNKGASDVSFYAPTSYGSSGQFLKANGENNAPTWETVTIPTKSSWNYDDVYVKYTAAQSLTDAQKTQARSNIGAGTSSFTGYTSSNKLHTDYINNAAGWTSVTETTVSNWGFTKNTGTVTSVRVQAGTGLSSSTSTAQTSSLNTTISIADGYKLLTTTEYNTLNAKQDKISALGTTTKPIYFSSNGVVSACLNYGGGTKVTLNGTEHKGSNATMYAPTTAGTSGYSLKSNGSGAPRWANESTVQVSGTISSGAKNNASVTFVITNSSKPLRKGVWRYSGTHGVFLIFVTTEITTMGSPRTEYICGYVSSSISNNTSITLVEV